MFKAINTVLLPILLVSLYGCDSGRKTLETRVIHADAERLKAHVTFLADDLLEGRDTGSRGYDIAAAYVAAELTKLNIKPAGDNASYFQQVPLRQSLVDTSSVSLTISDGQVVTPLQFQKEFVAIANVGQEQINISAPMVFAGYGIESDLLNHHDYQGLDVSGKIVVVLYGQPRGFPSEEGAHFGRFYERYKNAVQAGAVGLIAVQTPDGEKNKPFDRIVKSKLRPELLWLKGDGSPANTWPQLEARGFVDIEPGKKLFVGADRSLDDIFSRIENGEKINGFDLKVSATFKYNNILKPVSSSNVVGIIEGSDPVLKSEYVAYTAHLDHLGRMSEEEGGEIFNGALDNASGVAVLLETARMFTEMKPRPKRSILLTIVTGEEKGLLGSDYFVNHPSVPLASIVANINLDMPFLLYPIKSVIAFGAPHSSLLHNTKRALDSMNLLLEADPFPERAIFVRSDHYQFVRKGIPSVYLTTGTQSSDLNVDAGKRMLNFVTNHYHQTGDNLDLSIDWQSAKLFSELSLSVGLDVANQQERPSWNKDDFFGDTFTRVY